MIVAVLSVELHIFGASSLKDKRIILRGLKDRIGKKFNVSIAEVDFLDKWQRSRIGIAQVGKDYSYLEKNINSIIKILEENISFEIIDRTIEYL
jgi:uncharacterized protein YlxP (DUF503 family)